VSRVCPKIYTKTGSKSGMPKLIPSFPPYEGPYQVGTVEIEIPVSALMGGLREDEGIRVKLEQKETTIHTILFRIYYPATGEHPDGNEEGKQHGRGWGGYLHGLIKCGKRKPVYWVPEPYQEEFLKGYLRFGGLSREWLVNWIGYVFAIERICGLVQFSDIGVADARVFYLISSITSPFQP